MTAQLHHARGHDPPSYSPGDGMYEAIDSAIWWLLTSKIIVSRMDVCDE